MPEKVSIGAAKIRRGTIEGMPKTLAERVKAVRAAAGYGGKRKASAFATLVGIKPSSLHDIETAETKSLSQETIAGFVKIGANPEYLLHERGLPMLRPVQDKEKRVHELLAKLLPLSDHQIGAVEGVVESFAIDRAEGDEILRDAKESGNMALELGEENERPRLARGEGGHTKSETRSTKDHKTSRSRHGATVHTTKHNKKETTD